MHFAKNDNRYHISYERFSILQKSFIYTPSNITKHKMTNGEHDEISLYAFHMPQWLHVKLNLFDMKL